MSEFKWLKEAVDKIDSKMESMDQRLDKVDNTLVKNTASLEEHIRRTNAAEENIELLRKEVEPLKTALIKANFLFKLCGIVASVIAVGYYTVHIISYFSS